jgi:hypothetical protein
MVPSIKITVFGDVTSCNLVDVKLHHHVAEDISLVRFEVSTVVTKMIIITILVLFKLNSE